SGTPPLRPRILKDSSSFCSHFAESGLLQAAHSKNQSPIAGARRFSRKSVLPQVQVSRRFTTFFSCSSHWYCPGNGCSQFPDQCTKMTSSCSQSHTPPLGALRQRDSLRFGSPL